MNKIDIIDTGETIEFPSVLSECNSTQFMTIMELASRFYKHEIDEFELKLLMAYTCLNMEATNKLQLKTMSKKDRNAFHENQALLAETMNSFFVVEEEGGFRRFNTNGLIENKIPSFVHHGIKYLGPATALSDLYVKEYKSAHTAMINYQNDPNDEDLCTLIASLYMAEMNGIRSPFDEHSLEKRATVFSDLPFCIKLGIFLWYQACEMFLVSGTFYVEGIPICLSELFESKDSDDMGLIDRKPGDIGFLGVLFALAQDPVFCGIESVDNQKLYTVLLRLYQVHKQQKK